MLFSETRWKILELIAKGNKTPTELAKELNISIQSIQSHLDYLEKNNIIKKTKQRKGKTRPFTQYSIGNGFVYFIKVLPNETEKLFLKVNDELQLHLKIWSIPQQEFHPYIEKYFRIIEEHYPKELESFAVFGSAARGNAKPDSDIDVLILVNCTKEVIKDITEKFGNILVGNGDRKGIMAQIFSPEDFKDSLEKGSQFLKEIIKYIKIIYDKNRLLEKIKDGYNATTV